MSLSDPIADFLTSLRNASKAGKPHVESPASKIGAAIAECLKQEGFVQNWRLLDGTAAQKTLRVYLKYTKDRKPVLRHIRRISKPGSRTYVSMAKLPRILSGMGMSLLTTSKGILTDTQARAQGVGGEVICHVW